MIYLAPLKLLLSPIKDPVLHGDSFHFTGSCRLHCCLNYVKQHELSLQQLFSHWLASDHHPMESNFGKIIHLRVDTRKKKV